jgi:hypothetical protein
MRHAMILSTLLIAGSSFGVTPQTSDGASSSQALELMKNPIWTEREKGFKVAIRLVKSQKQTPQDINGLHLGLIQLLLTENAHAKTPFSPANGTQSDGANHEEYFATLIGAVADLNDARAIPALLAVAGTGGVATRGVARFGKTAVDAVVAQIQGQDPVLAGGALFVIRDMLEFHEASDPASQAKIKGILRNSLERPEITIRESALYALEYLDDREEFVPKLRDLADNDPKKLVGQKSDDGQDNGEVYPVRRMARSLLAKIASHERPAIDQGVRP